MAIVLGMVGAAIAGGPILRQVQRSEANAAAAAIQDLERRTRIASIGRGGSWQASGRELRGRVAGQEGQDWALVPSGGLAVSLLVDERPAGLLAYDDRGRSLPALVILRRESDQMRFRIDGLTGAWTYLDATGSLQRQAPGTP